MKFFARAMVAASAVSMVAISTAKADSPDLGTAGSADVLTAFATGSMTITFLHSRAEFNNYLVLFAHDGTGVVTDGAQAGYPNPLITVLGSDPAVGVGVPLSVDIDVVAGQVLLFGICTSGTVNPPGGDPNSGCTVANTLAFYTGPASNNLDGLLHAVIMTAEQWNAAALLSGCTPDDPFGPTNCFLAAPGTTVVGFEDIGGNLGDQDWNDLVFSFTNVTTIPEPGTMGLLALGLVGLSGAGLVRRRSAKRN